MRLSSRARQSGTTLSLAAVAVTSMLSTLAAAHDFSSTDGTIKISNVWTRATPAGAPVAAGYLTITNAGTEPDRLIGGTFAAASKADVHEMSMANGVMKMQQRADGIEIPAGGTVELKPGGYHMMFIGLTAPIDMGTQIDGTLVFKRAGTIAVHYHAEAIGAAAMAPMDHAGSGGAEPMGAMKH